MCVYNTYTLMYKHIYIRTCTYTRTHMRALYSMLEEARKRDAYYCERFALYSSPTY